MPSVAELTSLYTGVLLNPQPGPGVCETCFTFTDGYQRCYARQRAERTLDVVAPISYSVAGEQLHHALAGYKRLGGDIARRMQVEIVALLWRYLADHERCIAAATGIPSFPLVTTVPSSDPGRDERHPLRHIVGEIVLPTRDRYERLLTRSDAEVDDRTINAEKYLVARKLSGEPVLLIDDTWTTGANAQSAAAALRHRGRRPDCLRRHRPPHQARLGRQRPTTARAAAAVRLGGVQLARSLKAAIASHSACAHLSSGRAP